MCVISVYENNYPKLEDLELMEAMNGHGGSIAWRQNNKVHWKKSITARDIMQTIQQNNIQLPFVIHFRIASIGDNTPELNHPFPISPNVETDLIGSADSVLFHNGTWSEYSDYMIKACLYKSLHAPNGKISDSRIMAWLAYHYGVNFLNEVIGSVDKVIIFSNTEIIKLGTFQDYQNQCQVSNTYFEQSQNWNSFSDNDMKDLEKWYSRATIAPAKKKSKKYSKKKYKEFLNKREFLDIADLSSKNLTYEESNLLLELTDEWGYTYPEILKALNENNDNFIEAYQSLTAVQSKGWFYD